jgi:hypothetical protein
VADASQAEAAIAPRHFALCVPESALTAYRQSAGRARHWHLFLEQFGVVFVVLVRVEFFKRWDIGFD